MIIDQTQNLKLTTNVTKDFIDSKFCQKLNKNRIYFYSFQVLILNFSFVTFVV